MRLLPQGPPGVEERTGPEPADRFVSPAHGMFSLLDRSGRLKMWRCLFPGRQCQRSPGLHHPQAPEVTAMLLPHSALPPLFSPLLRAAAPARPAETREDSEFLAVLTDLRSGAQFSVSCWWSMNPCLEAPLRPSLTLQGPAGSRRLLGHVNSAGGSCQGFPSSRRGHSQLSLAWCYPSSWVTLKCQAPQLMTWVHPTGHWPGLARLQTGAGVA